ncbi:MAG TPA: DUF2252 family protein [Myxococcaceae bacterium]|nr:DUF2252 family protein [Myxococcaceae bacterium]
MDRDPIAEIISYNKPLLQHEVPREDDAKDLTRQALQRKIEALTNSTFQFFRGTFHLMAWDLLLDRVPGAKTMTPEGLIVGDLHVENFGIYRGQSGELCFDVNDFDDVGSGPLDLDLKRLCTSAMLLPGLTEGVRVNAARGIALAWAEEIDKLGGRFPVPPWTVAKADGRVRELLQEHGHKKPEDLIAKVAPGKGHMRFDDPQKFARPARPWIQCVEKAFAEYQDYLEQLKAPDAPKSCDILDIAYCFKGTGSLGRLRFSVLVSEGNERRVFELKEARPSVMDAARNLSPPRDRGRAQTASIRRLQGDPWPRVAATHLGKLAALGRENEPSEEKIDSDRFARGDAHHEELLAYARQCGQVLARLHCRHNAPVMFDTAWSAADAARSAIAFAPKYAEQVASDHKAFVQTKWRVAEALGL